MIVWIHGCFVHFQRFRYANISPFCLFQAGHVCGDDRDLINGRPTGSVRISFGYMSTLQDAQHCLRFIVENFLETSKAKPLFTEKWEEMHMEGDVKLLVNSFELGRKMEVTDNRFKDIVALETDNRGSCSTDVGLLNMSQVKDALSDCTADNVIRLTNICLYPVKSCAAFMVSLHIHVPNLSLSHFFLSSSTVHVFHKYDKSIKEIKPYNPFFSNFPQNPHYLPILVK